MENGRTGAQEAAAGDRGVVGAGEQGGDNDDG